MDPFDAGSAAPSAVPTALYEAGEEARASRRSSRRYAEETGPAPASGWRRGLLLVARGVFALGLSTAILFQGAVSAVPLTAASLLVGTAGLLAVFGTPPSGVQRRAVSRAILLACILAAYAWLQSVSLPAHLFANPIWDRVGDLLGTTTRAISVDPSATRAAILPLLLPIATYAVGLALFSSDDDAFKLLRILAALGIAFAAFGLAQVIWFPKSLLLETKTAYLGSLTSVFVNRNTAGTFLGIAALICLTLLMRRIRLLPTTVGLRDVFASARVSDRQKLHIAIYGVAVLMILLALVLTHSRGALLSGVAALGLVLPLLVLDGEQARRHKGEGAPRAGWRRWRTVGLIAVAIPLVLALVGGQTLLRADVLGVDQVRLCLYRGTIAAFDDNWRFGTGLGTFASVFPAYRDAACETVYATFQRAHNVYLEGLQSLGIAFVPLTIFVYAHILWTLFRGQRTRRSQRFVPLVAIGAVLLVTLHGLVDFSLQIPGLSLYVGAYLAAATTISLRRTRERFETR